MKLKLRSNLSNSIVCGLIAFSGTAFISCGESGSPTGPGAKKQSENKNKTEEKKEDAPTVAQSNPAPVILSEVKLTEGAVRHQDALRKCAVQHFDFYERQVPSPSNEVLEMYRRTLCGSDAKDIANKIIELKNSESKGEGSYFKKNIPSAFEDGQDSMKVFTQVFNWKAGLRCDSEPGLSTDLYTSSSIYGPSAEADVLMKNCLAAETKSATCRAQESGNEVKLLIQWNSSSDRLTAIDAEVTDAENFTVSESDKKLKLNSGTEVEVALARVDATKSGKVTVKSGEIELCTVETSRVLRGSYRPDEYCGVQSRQALRTEHCGVESLNEGTGEVCGVDLFRSDRTDNCGVESYKEERHYLCLPERYIEREFGLPVIKHRFGVCRMKEFGVEQYKECRSDKHPVERYKTCRNEIFGKVYRNCHHEKHPPETFKTCFVYEVK